MGKVHCSLSSKAPVGQNGRRELCRLQTVRCRPLLGTASLCLQMRAGKTPQENTCRRKGEISVFGPKPKSKQCITFGLPQGVKRGSYRLYYTCTHKLSLPQKIRISHSTLIGNGAYKQARNFSQAAIGCRGPSPHMSRWFHWKEGLLTGFITHSHISSLSLKNSESLTPHL